MTATALMDTDILIEVARGSAAAIAYLQQLETKFLVGISAITYMELLVGCRNKIELTALNEFVTRFQIVKLNEFISDQAEELLRLYRLSHGLLIPDSLIAGTAITLNIPLATKNYRDYKFITGLQLLAYPN